VFECECIFFHLLWFVLPVTVAVSSIGLIICSVGSQAALSKLKEDLKHDPKLASQYGVVIKSKQTSFLILKYFLQCVYMLLVMVWRWCRYHHCRELSHLLLHPDVLVGVNKDM